MTNLGVHFPNGLPGPNELIAHLTFLFDDLIKQAGFSVGEHADSQTITLLERDTLFRRSLIKLEFSLRSDAEVKVDDELFLTPLKQKVWRSLSQWLDSRSDTTVSFVELNEKIQELLFAEEDGIYGADLEEEEVLNTLLIVLFERVLGEGFEITGNPSN